MGCCTVGALLALLHQKCTLRWCTFGAFAPKEHQKCTWPWCTFGAFAPEVHQKCTTFGQTAPKLHHMPKMHQKCIKSGALLVLFHQKCTLHWCTFGAFAPKEHQNCTSVAAELLEIWKKLENFSKKFPEKFDRLGKFSKNFPKFFQISSNTARALVQFWCNSTTSAPGPHQFCFGKIIGKPEKLHDTATRGPGHFSLLKICFGAWLFSCPKSCLHLASLSAPGLDQACSPLPTPVPLETLPCRSCTRKPCQVTSSGRQLWPAPKPRCKHRCPGACCASNPDIA